MNIISLFSGAGGLDKGFENCGFKTLWANEFDKAIWDTYRYNFPQTELNTQSIRNVDKRSLPKCDGLIGGPPCQSWSEAGALRGIKDKRGQLFFDYIDVLREKNPMFFLAENVSGMLSPRNAGALSYIKELFKESGYVLYDKLLNASNYSVPQDRKRIIFIGIRNDIDKKFTFPDEKEKKVFLVDSIYDLKDTAIPAGEKNYTKGTECCNNHEYMHGSFSSIYMSRNRVRSWNEPSFTIQAGGRHAPIHPNAPKMIKIEKNKQIFKPGYENLYRRLSVRECARIQTFDDNFSFKYNKVSDGYKMVGNAVPVKLSESIALQIKNILFD